MKPLALYAARYTGLKPGANEKPIGVRSQGMIKKEVRRKPKPCGLAWVEGAPRPFSAATCRRAGRRGSVEFKHARRAFAVGRVARQNGPVARSTQASFALQRQSEAAAGESGLQPADWYASH